MLPKQFELHEYRVAFQVEYQVAFRSNIRSLFRSNIRSLSGRISGRFSGQISGRFWGQISGRFPSTCDPEASIRTNAEMNFVKLSKIWIVITFFRLIYHQTEFRSVKNQKEKCNYNTNLIQNKSETDSSLCTYLQGLSLQQVWSNKNWISLYIYIQIYFSIQYHSL